MSLGAVLEAVGVVVGIAAIALLIRQAARSNRRLEARIDELRAEEEANPGATRNPWEALAEVYAEDERKDAEARRKRGGGR